MGTIFRDAGELAELKLSESQFILLDASILLEVCDLDHTDYRQRFRFFEQLAEKNKISCRFVLATRLYVRDILRRRFLTDFLRTHISRNLRGGSSTTASFDAVVERCLYHCHTDSSGLSLLSDWDLSSIRDACFKCFPTLEEGVRQWQFICKIALGKKFEIVSERLASIGIKYVDLVELGVNPGGKKPQWRKQEELMLQYGLSSSDTAVVSILEATDQVYGILSNAPDLIELLNLKGHLKSIRCYTFLKSFDFQKERLSAS